MDFEGTINKLRDTVNRRRRGLPLPNDLDVDMLLEEAAETIEALVKDEQPQELHCDGCVCDDDEDESVDIAKALAPIRERLRAAIDRASEAVEAIEGAIDDPKGTTT